MTYLFWASAVVWVGIFLYLYGLVRRSRALEHEVAALRDRSHSPQTRDGRSGAAGGRSRAGHP